MSEDIMQGTQDATQDEAPEARTFILMYDRVVVGTPGIVAPVFVAYIDTGEGTAYADINPDAWNSGYKVLERYLDTGEDTAVGKWWVGIMPRDGQNDYAYINLKPYTVTQRLDISM